MAREWDLNPRYYTRFSSVRRKFNITNVIELFHLKPFNNL